MTSPRARDIGIRIGPGDPGPLGAITDVPGVRVGHRTIVRGDDGDDGAVRTGVTAIFPSQEDPWAGWVYAGTHILNGYGEMIGVNQLDEWGVLMSPIVLTSSLLIGSVYEATVRWIAARDREAGEEIMPVVTECDDSWLSDALSFPVGGQDVAAALDGAVGGSVVEGNVGAGTGMACFDFKGGIGTASRIVPSTDPYTVGVLVLTNFGDRERLQIDGVQVGREISDLLPTHHQDGSCVVVIATDAPLLPHQLRRLAARGGMGLAAVGSYASNGSGEQMLAFSTANRLTHGGAPTTVHAIADGPAEEGWLLSRLFEATVDATQEAVVNAMFAAETMVGRHGRTLHAIPVDRVVDAMRRAGRPTA